MHNCIPFVNIGLGCGFASKKQYLFGRVSMKIKLIPGDSAGTVAAFYVTLYTNISSLLRFKSFGYNIKSMIICADEFGYRFYKRRAGFRVLRKSKWTTLHCAN